MNDEGLAVDVEHVVVLMLENRSFDHLLGYLRHPDPSFDGLLGGGEFTNPGWAGAAPVAASPSAGPVLPFGPDHSHDAVMEQLAVTAGRPTNQGFVRSYERMGRGLDKPAFGGLLGPAVGWVRDRRSHTAGAVTGRGPLAMACQPPENVPALSRLAREFAVCTRWFCSVPGETWPNRNFAHAATSDGDTDIEIRPYANRTIFELLEDHGADWRIYHDDTPQVWAFPALWDTPERHAKWFPLGQFAAHVAGGELAAYTFIEPNHRPPLHTLDHAPLVGTPDVSNSQHPENNLVSNAAYDTFTAPDDTDFTRADRLIATIYEALRSRADIFDRTLLLVTYDEHGGLYDHVPPPADVPSPGGRPSGIAAVRRILLHRKASAFDFTMLGPRVPAVVISPRVPAGTVDTQTHDHASIPATVRALFAPAAAPLTERDRWSAPWHHLPTLPQPRADLPDLSGYTAHAIAASAPATTAPAPAPPTQAPAMPGYYQSFTDLAEQVYRHLAAVGEPEAIAEQPTGGPADRSADISKIFTQAAHRHRHPA